MNAKFDEFLKSEGIQHRLTAPYTPQKNGVAKSMNRTLIEMARCLLIQSGLFSPFWVEAVSRACHIRNRCPTKKIEGMIPYQIWDIRTPIVREFGCRGFVLNKRVGKLNNISKEDFLWGMLLN